MPQPELLEKTQRVTLVEAAGGHAPGDSEGDEEALLLVLADLVELIEEQQESVVAGFRQIGERLRVAAERLQKLAEHRDKEREEAAASRVAPAEEGESDTPAADDSAASPAQSLQSEAPAEPVPERVTEPPMARVAPPPAKAAYVPTAMPAEKPPPMETVPSEAGSPAEHVGTVRPALPAGDEDWERVIFGEELAGNYAIGDDRRDLIDGLMTGDGSAAGLVGQLLAFRAAPADKMPQLLKDVGEAYYAWRPHTAGGDDPLRDALIEWLVERCAEEGVSNKIELVRPGDRFDRSRHNSKQPGGEVDDVHGWVVLRDNGKVYTKAMVAAK